MTGSHFLLASLLLMVTHFASMSLGNAAANRGQERIQLPVQILLMNSQVPFEKEEELLLHQVDLGAIESKAVEVGVDVGIVGPVLVLG